MDTFIKVAPSHVRNMYNHFIQSKIKNKQNIILEPLQVMIQLSLLSFCPIGTKITIHNNILSLQPPTLIQPINRWFNYDKKDDIYHLFQVIKRFIKWYHKENTIINSTLYNMLVELGKKGLDNLIKTYNNCDMLTIIPVLHMYKELLIKNDVNLVHDISKLHIEDKNNHELNEINKNMEQIFYNISSIYTVELINVIYNIFTLLLTEHDSNIIENYIDSINLILLNINNKITNWIIQNLIV
jgi:hypothetical protein